MVKIRVLILTQGTRGDVQPFIALTGALTRCGHDVCLGAPAWAVARAKEYGARCVEFSDVEAELMRDAAVREGFETNYHGIKGKFLMPQVARRHQLIMPKILNDLASCISDEFDVVVYHATLPGHEIAERMGVPAVPVCLEPWYVPTGAFPNPVLPIRGVPRVLNKHTYFISKLWIRALIGDTTEWRKKTLKLPARRGHRDHLRRPDGSRPTVLQPVSRHVLPSGTNYPAWLHTTGFWFLPAPPEWKPPVELERFIDDGDPPVYIGFGSVVGSDPSKKRKVVADAVRLAGARAIVVGGSRKDEVAHVDNHLLFVNDIPFDWLFPRVAAVVHHGGCGTIGLAAASGRPQVVCPAVYSQPFNARRMHELGVAPKPLQQRSLTSRTLAAAIERAINDPLMRTKSLDLSKKLNSENGLTKAINVLESAVKS